MRNENIRRTPGGWVPNGKTYTTWGCKTCGRNGGAACGRAFDGTEGCWCPGCNDKGIKSPMVTVEAPDMDHVRGYTEVRCCGRWMHCGGFTNTCRECGTDYNSAGQQLAPREQWGEETGEHYSDILRIP